MKPMQIVTYHVPHGTDRRYDWQALDARSYEGSNSPIGTGATEAEARADLLRHTALLAPPG